MVIELPQGYYLSNFQEMIEYVVEQYADLLSPVELDFYQGFNNLSSSAKMLYVRMLTRKGNYFRQSKLQYAEIPDTNQSAQELAKIDFITIDKNHEISPLLGLFNKPEWLAILSRLPVEKSRLADLKKLKRKMFDEVIHQLSLEIELPALIKEPIFHLKYSEVFETYKLLFFGNLNQDLTEFVLRDLGHYRFENYTIDKNARLFSSRQQIEQYLDYYRLTAELDQVLGKDKDVITALHQSLPVPLDDKILDRRIQRVNLQLARQLERLNQLDQALVIYEQCQLPPARERRARILVKQSAIENALCLCNEIKESPVDESEAVFADDFGYRTAKKYQFNWLKPLVYVPPDETITIVPTGQGVEIDVATHFQSQGDCYFVENALFLSLFGLHFWDVFFAPVRGAFTNPFQIRPHDLYDDDFKRNRLELFNQLNSQLEHFNRTGSALIKRRQQKMGIATPFVFWDLIDEEIINLALARIPNNHWRKIFDRLWLDLRANRSGFPDLILFPASGGYRLIEVKGPGDRLQKNQIRWMQYFAQHAIPHQVVHVEWSTPNAPC